VINATTGISLQSIIREVLPFLVVLLIALVVIVLVPEVVLWLPKTVGYHG